LMTVPILVLANALPWQIGVALGMLMVGGVVLMLNIRYRNALQSAIESLKMTQSELHNILTETTNIGVKHKDAALLLIHEQKQVKSSLEMKRQNAKTNRTMTIEILNIQKNKAAEALVAQQSLVNHQFDNELRTVRDSLNNITDEFDRQLAEINVELQSATNLGVREECVLAELRKYSIINADESYFGEVLKQLLVAEGLTTAADVTRAIVLMPEIGPLRGSAALSWRTSVESHVRSKLSRQTSETRKTAQLTDRKSEILAMQQACKVELIRLQAEVESRRTAELSRLQQLASDQDEAFDLEITRVKTESEAYLKRIRNRLHEIKNLPELALWNKQIENLDVRVQYIKELLGQIQSELSSSRNYMTFWSYLRSL
jgi:DNA-binding helix-hairpin-helix protein with protein kinase domain